MQETQKSEEHEVVIHKTQRNSGGTNELVSCDKYIKREGGREREENIRGASCGINRLET